MTLERQNAPKPNEYKKSFKPNESVLINGIVGITVTYKHNQIHISIIDDKTLRQKTDHLGPTLFKPLIIGDLEITTSLDENNNPQIKVESDEKIQSIVYSYPHDFLKLFEYRKQNG